MTDQPCLEVPFDEVEKWEKIQGSCARLYAAAEWGYKQALAIPPPEPPSLRKQAYDALDTYIYGEPDPKDKERTYNTIRQALEALPND